MEDDKLLTPEKTDILKKRLKERLAAENYFQSLARSTNKALTNAVDYYRGTKDGR